MNAFIFLQGVDNAEEVIGGGVAAGTKHTRQTFWRFLHHGPKFLEANSGIDIVA